MQITGAATGRGGLPPGGSLRPRTLSRPKTASTPISTRNRRAILTSI
jgi:hypothetical protein